jgi:hypothetical protein
MVESVYVAGGLTGTSDSYKDFLKTVILVFEAKIMVNRFFSLQILKDPSIDGQNRYLFNQRQVLRSDALVAFCDYPSIGVGMEVMIAHRAKKKIIILHKASLQLAKMPLEFANYFEYPVLPYSSFEPITQIVEKILAKLNK